ncbi:MAG: enoyl-CoA hydratase/isomerase family protein [Acidimicrobiaceae bacterium]|nr:enoyl-CoA hydratase/isomerase family protein [Acidimicrobiaceae bacterium]MYC42098.1 enoyl-CoA hydratase/isomerase family protein [Acidimicrobiaceae bacterium]MYG54312.1 enoyl-CoA hydratase/isomerase family protein [Acidimicrobiaceae bacterium]MYJ99841.1 enoyl-CoA hydratase/isomerase family protein [Acidimicrobiaceae bacterium]
MIEVTDDQRVRIITLKRPEAKNAMNSAMWDGLAEALIEAESASGVAVVVITGSGDSFSAGQDVIEMGRMAMGERVEAVHGFSGVASILIDFPKPLILAVNGMGVGFGATVLGLADLVFMSSAARVKCPFTMLGVAPELASSGSIPALIGRQNASWVLLSSEWITADECLEMGLAFKVCEPDELMATAMSHAQILAAKPISSLIASKRTIVEPIRAALHEAHTRENAEFAALMGGSANIEAMTAFAEKRPPNFDGID